VTATMPVADRLPMADGGGWTGASGAPRLAVAGRNADSSGGASLVRRGYVRARFGGVPVLVGPELAAQIKAIRQKQP
jgi:hypothetical protein